MMTRNLACALILSAVLAIPTVSFCGEGYTVTLTNGNTLTVNSYEIKGDKVHIRFPVGDAELRRSEIVSIKDDGGKAVLFQEKGVYAPEPKEAGPTVSDGVRANLTDTYNNEAVSTTHPGSKLGRNAERNAPVQNFGSAGYQPVQRQWAKANYTPQTQDIDNFIDEMFKADQEGRDIPDAQVDQAFSSFFDDGSGSGTATTEK